MESDGIHYNFGPYLWSTQLPKNIIDRLLEVGLRSKDDHSMHLAGVMEDEKKYHMQFQEEFVKLITPYINSYIEKSKNHFKWQLYENLKEIRLEALWINRMRSGECNPPHIHHGDLSFVIFLKVPEELKTEVENFKGTSSGPGTIEFSYGEFSPHALSKHSFLPEVGQMFIFPATLSHSVNTFKSDVERISVSGNFIFACDKYNTSYFR